MPRSYWCRVVSVQAIWFSVVSQSTENHNLLKPLNLIFVQPLRAAQSRGKIILVGSVNGTVNGFLVPRQLVYYSVHRYSCSHNHKRYNRIGNASFIELRIQQFFIVINYTSQRNYAIIELISINAFVYIFVTIDQGSQSAGYWGDIEGSAQGYCEYSDRAFRETLFDEQSYSWAINHARA